MAMKKKFLGLALATAVALPASSVYANTNTQTLTGTQNKVFNQNVTVSGSVLNKEGTAPAGKIEVELPTAMTFSVDQDGNFEGTRFNVDNRGSVGIDVFVDSFRVGNDGNITVKKKEELTSSKASLDRSNVYLELKGTAGGADTSVDLGKVKASELSNENDRKILNVPASSNGLITLEGGAGTGFAENGNNDDLKGIDKTGASGDFTLVFKIQKDTK